MEIKLFLTELRFFKRSLFGQLFALWGMELV